MQIRLLRTTIRPERRRTARIRNNQECRKNLTPLADRHIPAGGGLARESEEDAVGEQAGEVREVDEEDGAQPPWTSRMTRQFKEEMPDVFLPYIKLAVPSN